MVTTAWTNNGKVVVDGSGKIILCDHCPCGGTLYAGGDFTTADGTTVNHIANWNGTTWTAVGSGFDDSVNTLCVYGGKLYAGGFFTTSGGTACGGLAVWSGSSWEPVGGDISITGDIPFVRHLLVYNGKLLVIGYFDNAGGSTVNGLALWDGSSWGVLGTVPLSASRIDMAAIDPVSNQLLIFRRAGGFNTSCYYWDGSTWTALHSSAQPGDVPTWGDYRTAFRFGGFLWCWFLYRTSGDFSTDSWDGVNYNNQNGDGVAAGQDPIGKIIRMISYKGELYAVGYGSRTPGPVLYHTPKWHGDSSWRELYASSYSDLQVSLAAVVFQNDLILGGTDGGSGAGGILIWDGTTKATFGTGSNFNDNVRALVIFG